MKMFTLRRLLLALLVTGAGLTASAQVPKKMSFQAIIRNASNDIVSNSPVSIRITILQGSPTGTVVYREVHSPTTNPNGLATIFIGTGTPVTGIFDSVDWSTGHYYYTAETDPSGGTSYTVATTSQFVTVPYAFYAEKSGVPGAMDLATITTGPVSGITYTTATSTDTLKANGGEFVFARGVCVDTLPLPNVNSSFVSPGTSIGHFTLNLTALLPGKRYYLRAFATNSNGTAYGDTISFTTVALSAPTVTTDTVSNIGNVSAQCGGNVTSDGGTPVTARGICYSTSASPTIANSVSASGSGLGVFSTTMSGLTPATTYYARAYATNATGTSYGVQRTFTTILFTAPVVTTDTSTNVACTSATSGLSAISDGNSAITQQGICYSTSVNPTTANTKIFAPSTAVGHYTLNMSGLAVGTTYYIRAFSTNSIGTSYGAQITFSTLPQATPTVTTNPIIDINTTSATSGGNVIATGCSNVTARGICWGTNASAPPTIDSAKTTNGSGTGIYNSNMTGLAPGTTYYVRAYATNSASGTNYGPTLSFTTLSVLSTVFDVPVLGTTSPNTGTGAVISGGYISNSNGSEVTVRGVCWATAPNPTISSSRTTDGSGSGFFSSELALTGCGTTYYVRAYATNSAGTGYGNQYILPAGALPVLVDSPITSITGVSAVCGGSVLSDGGCAVTQKGICWGITPNPTTTTNNLTSWKTTLGGGTGTFSSTLTGLIPGYTYHLRTYVTSPSGTVYGANQTFAASTTHSALHIGQTYAGGIIFYIDGTGTHGLIAAPSDISSGAQWGCYGSKSGDTATAIGTGQSNTAAILANCTQAGTAAKICDTVVIGGYNDWFLPSGNEMRLLLSNLAVYGLANFPTSNSYWTSSEYETTSAWGSSFCTTCIGGVYVERSTYNKASNLRVRPVRRF